MKGINWGGGGSRVQTVEIKIVEGYTAERSNVQTMNVKINSGEVRGGRISGVSI